jgi:hypothetical protein
MQNIRLKSQFLTDFAQKIRDKERAFHDEEKRFEGLKSQFLEIKKQNDYEKYANDAKLRVLNAQLQDVKVCSIIYYYHLLYIYYTHLDREQNNFKFP